MKRKMIVIAIIMMAVGCQTESDRVAELATKHASEQSQLSRETVELQTELIEGTRQLVDADAQSRRDFLELEGKLDEQRAELVDRHDELERERRDIAKRRYRDPIIANAMTAIGTLFGCMLPLLLAGYLLRCQLREQDDYTITEILLEEIAIEAQVIEQTKVPMLDRDSDTPRLADNTHEAPPETSD